MTKTVKPASANDVLFALREDHNWRHDQMDLTSTGGIQRNIQALWNAVQALADYADGIATGTTDTDGTPIKSDAAIAAEAQRASAESPLFVGPDPKVLAPSV